ncbi:hypothetical protein VF14_03180 [Nostoc linckia z18]|uniref:Uncharacterized protein n=2 Tax=Nostoc linckia TaxID=92942 RepID=A0A9Q5ZH65_NOSLI|nr:hypothetical protein [Nostoc linckia]PHK42383.1 hypothetical protein VF12_03195 [Nostoc linckia z15]PHK46824.1 hypothetical protein VF13_09065 [Nostoc linckia z16]PHJ69153.1 hypothetical protein VF02_00650 [Nostoc linckia z1]PHJ73304.1 hypothetical protein VF05_01665 [Nostoc linckia z3]PHJ78651.1 hypothetical protein VF03_00650 [Nostoc linckia z2]
MNLVNDLVIHDNQFVLAIIAPNKTFHSLVINNIEEAVTLTENYRDIEGHGWCRSFVLDSKGNQVAYFTETELTYPGQAKYKNWQTDPCGISALLCLVSKIYSPTPGFMLVLDSRGYAEFENIQSLNNVPTLNVLCVDLDAAIEKSHKYIKDHNLGFKEWAGGYLFDISNGKCAYYISYWGEIICPGDRAWVRPHLVSCSLQPLYVLMHQNQSDV